jgi:hypothetical protein
MANTIPFSFRGALFSGDHNFSNGGNSYRMSLYVTDPYTENSTIYTNTGEVLTTGGTGYSPFDLVNQTVTATTNVAAVDWTTDPSWANATFTASFAAIYKYDAVTAANQLLVVMLDFGGAKTATNGTFTVAFPAVNTAADAIISMS